MASRRKDIIKNEIQLTEVVGARLANSLGLVKYTKRGSQKKSKHQAVQKPYWRKKASI